MQNKFTKLMLAGVFGTTLALPAFGDGHSYGPFPITLKGYSGDKTNSVSYSGQIARHVQHDSLKKLAGSGNLAEMMAYFKGSDKNVLEELTDEYNAFKRQEEASKYPGYFGTQDKFMEGGIASLNVKK